MKKHQIKPNFSFIKITAALLLFSCVFIANAFAKDISFGLTLDRDNVEVGDMVNLGLVFEDARSIPAPQLPQIKGIRSQYVGPTTKVTNYNGTMASSVTHKYALVVMQTGKFTIGPFSFKYKGDTYTSPSKDLVVVDRGQGPVSKSTQGDSVARQQNLEERIFVILSAEKNKAYLNEPIRITVKLYVNELSIQGIEYPVLDAKGLVVEPFSQPRQYKEQLAGKFYDVVEFNTMVYASQQGSLKIGPASIKAKAVSRQPLRNKRRGIFGSDFFDDSFFGDFFGRANVVPIEVTSPELSLNVLGFPEQNKPKEFSGAVGSFDLEVNADPLKLKAGDPITLKMGVIGSGNFDSIKSPELIDPQGFKLYSPEGQKENSDLKTFEQVIIPQNPDVRNIPAIRFAFFDPQKQDYVIRENPPIKLEVLPADEKIGMVIDTSKQAVKQTATKILGKDILYIKEDIGKTRKKGMFLHNNKGFILFNIIAFLGFIGVLVWAMRKDRLSTDIGYARKLKAPKLAKQGINKAKSYLSQGKKELFYEQIFKTLQEYLGHRFNRPAAGITAEVVAELVANKSLSHEIAEKLKHCFLRCDMARYASADIDSMQMEETLRILEDAIDYLERHKQ